MKFPVRRLQCAGYKDAQARDRARAQMIQKKLQKTPIVQ